MALQTDDLPGNVDESKVYVVKGKTLAKLIKKAKQKLVFSKADFTVMEDDNKTTVTLRGLPADSSSIYQMGTYDGADENSAYTDEWYAASPPEGTCGVQYSGARLVYGGGSPPTWTLYSRFVTFDASGKLSRISQEYQTGLPITDN